MNNNLIRGLVYAKYATVKDFTKDIGWKPGKAYRIVSGDQEASLSDVNNICEFFGLSAEERDKVFFRKG